MIKGGQTPLSNSNSIDVSKNVIAIYFQKWILIFRFCSGLKSLPLEPVFRAYPVFYGNCKILLQKTKSVGNILGNVIVVCGLHYVQNSILRTKMLNA